MVIDSTSGLTWLPTGISNKNWLSVLAYCENLEYAGHDDWRLPNANELSSILNYSKDQTPYSDFPTTLNGSFFSSSDVGSNRVRSINLNNGKFGHPGVGESMAAICVRSDIVGNPTRQAACLGLPENAQWNSVKSIEQTWDGTEWVGVSRDGVYNEEASTTECRFVCKTNYTWNDNSGLCEADTQEEIQCTGLPANAEWWNGNGVITQTWSGSEWFPVTTGYYSESVSPSEDCSFKCLDNHVWDGSLCLPECSQESGTPCMDSSKSLVWSSRSENTMDQGHAFSYCNGLEEGGYTDWRLPNVDEVRTLIQNCPGTETGGACPVSDPDHLATTDRTQDCSCATVNDPDGYYSKLGDGDLTLWTSNSLSDWSFSWFVIFSSTAVTYNSSGVSNNVRCVRSQTQQATCTGLPANAQWNSVSSITQKWNGTAWYPSNTGVYNETASTGECRFKCEDGYVWTGTACVENFCQNNPCLSDVNSNGECSVIDAGYVCGCDEGYFWNNGECKPLTLGNICTNQTSCYNASSSITCPAEGEDFYGQDAQHTSTCTAQSFTAGTGAQAGTVIDNNTGLVWEQSPSENEYTWDDAHNHCDDLNSANYGGKNNWRVPNPLEFMTIVDNSTYNPATNSNFTNMPDYSVWFWTSAENKGYTSYAYAFKPYYGNYTGSNTSSYSKTKTYKVLCVSGNEM